MYLLRIEAFFSMMKQGKYWSEIKQGQNLAFSFAGGK